MERSRFSSIELKFALLRCFAHGASMCSDIKSVRSGCPKAFNRRPHSSLGPGFLIRPSISPCSANARGIVSTDQIELWRTPY
jgi:hypothetical protein